MRMADMFEPKYDAAGLLTAVVVHAETGAPLMVAHMNAEAVRLTRETGKAHFWSRSRQAQWLKGETSGHYLNVREIWVDCDQDCLWVKAIPDGPACHTGAESCFFRRLDGEKLITVDGVSFEG